MMDPKITPSGQTIVGPRPSARSQNTDAKLLIYGLFQKGRVLAQDEVDERSITARMERLRRLNQGSDRRTDPPRRYDALIGVQPSVQLIVEDEARPRPVPKLGPF